MKCVICISMYGLGGHYAQWNKSDRERQILYDITYIWNLKNTTVSEYNKNEAELQIQWTNQWLPVEGWAM